MSPKLLIDAIVRQTMVLIAQLATSGGLRAPLAHVAGQAFLELARELESQGVSKKVSADMFGMALRTYQRRTQRLSQSRTERGRSLWEAVLGHISKNELVTRDEVLKRFRHDDEHSLKGVLRDLCESSLVFASGSGKARAYRVATSDELERLRGDDALGLEAYLWTRVFGSGRVSSRELADATGLDHSAVESALENLIASGRVERVTSAEGEQYQAHELVLGFDDPAGWEASVFDHFSTMVQTITNKLARDQKASLQDQVGGSTYHFKLFRGHPLEEEVLGELKRFRERMSRLRTRVDEINAMADDDHPDLRVHAYYGQWVREDESDDTTDDD